MNTAIFSYCCEICFRSHIIIFIYLHIIIFIYPSFSLISIVRTTLKITYSVVAYSHNKLCVLRTGTRVFGVAERQAIQENLKNKYELALGYRLSENSVRNIDSTRAHFLSIFIHLSTWWVLNFSRKWGYTTCPLFSGPELYVICTYAQVGEGGWPGRREGIMIMDITELWASERVGRGDWRSWVSVRDGKTRDLCLCLSARWIRKQLHRRSGLSEAIRLWRGQLSQIEYGTMIRMPWGCSLWKFQHHDCLLPRVPSLPSCLHQFWSN